MKKLFIFVIIFAIVSVLVTYVLILLNQKQIMQLSQFDITKKISSLVNPEEKTIDLYGTYNVNNIDFYNETINIDGLDKETTILQISGLKDKKIEDKINQSMKEKVCDFLTNNFLKTQDEVENILLDNLFFNNGYIEANFSNVISLCYYYSYYESDENYEVKHDIRDNLYLNYNLVDGEIIRLEDLFKDENDIENIAQIALYKNWQEEEESTYFYMEYEEPYYDKELDGWYQKIGEYNENKGEYEYKIIEYVPNMTEYEISKILRKYMNNKEKNFYFTSDELVMEFNTDNTSYKIGNISFEKIADKIVIYSKYLTSKSIYENVESRSMITCTLENTNSKYKDTKYYKDNFLYDIDVQMYESDTDYYKNNPYNEYYFNKIDEIYNNEGIQLIDEYKDIASNNKNNYYILFVEIVANRGGDYERSYNSLISIETKAKLIVCKMEEKKEMLDKVLSVYREEMRYVGNIYDAISMIEYSYDFNTGEETREVDLNEIKFEIKFYDAETENEINSIEELFKDNMDYTAVIVPRLFLSSYSIPCDINTLTYKMTSSGIEVNGENDYYNVINYSDIIDYLKIKQIKIRVLPSDERLLYDYDIDHMTKENLVYAYNEILARHGQDFSNQEFKRFFSDFYWYEPIENKEVSVDELSDIERANLYLIKEEIDSRM